LVAEPHWINWGNKVMAAFRLVAGQVGKFHLVSGKIKSIKVVGMVCSPTTSNETMLILEVDGVEGKFPDLQSALGEPYQQVTI
jgi:hypothetical protein